MSSALWYRTGKEREWMPHKPHSEIGRELHIEELVLRTVVIVEKVGCAHLMTMWVELIGKDFVIFLAQALKPPVHFVASRKDEQLRDATGIRIKVYEWIPTGDDGSSSSVH